MPQNAEPVDLDGDGDLDIVVGSRGENRLLFFENTEDGSLGFREHAIGIFGARAAGFNLEFADLNRDGRLDIVAAAELVDGQEIAWLASSFWTRSRRLSSRGFEQLIRECGGGGEAHQTALLAGREPLRQRQM